MQASVWQKALNQCADRDWAERHLALLTEAGLEEALAAVTPEQARVLTALFSGSQALSEGLAAHPEWLGLLLDVEGLRFPRTDQGMRREVSTLLNPLVEQQDHAGALGRLRTFKAREMLRIGARDLAGLAKVDELTRELSDVADVCLDWVHRICRARLTGRHGRPYHQDPEGNWRETPFCVLGLGKLGGQELNYSSDVDVMFVYDEEGFVFRDPPTSRTKPGQGMASHDFFRRLCEAFIEEVRQPAAEGQLFRIDLRLRPEGPAGPLARSLSSYEAYYAQYGQTWERMMLIKARGVAGDRTLAGEFLELVQPFRHPRSVSPRFVQEIAAMKERTETEVVRTGGIHRDVKRGRGGIREIEFIAQTLQLLHAGREPFLADPQTVPALSKLARYNLLGSEEVNDLTAAYEFLRAVEHRLQMEHNRQTHSLPEDPSALARLARLMGFSRLRDFEAQLNCHRRLVRGMYERFVPGGSQTGREVPRFEGNEDRWRELLAERGFRDPEKALRLARGFVHGPGFALVTTRTEELGRNLMGRFLELCPRAADLEMLRQRSGAGGDPKARWLSDPDRVLARLDSFVTAYGARSVLFDSWESNASLFELLLLLFDRSEFLAEAALREIDLVDALEQSGRLRISKTVEQTLEDLRFGRDDPDQHLWLRKYHQAEFMRIGLRDILGLADFEQNLAELSALAEACLRYALEVVLRRRRYKHVPLAIIGLGKLGGSELNYGSDLDIVFVAEDRVRDLSRLQGIATDVMDLIGARTEMGTVFEVDARLRPDGEKGLLVNNLSAFGDYYRRRAWLWEIQAMARARPVAGNEELGSAFMQLVAELADFRTPDAGKVAAQKAEWRQEVAHMRRRIEKERVKPGREALAIKTGAGGL
ncbi:MAG: bifunctional [glutamate--ammonia ligase]-adenylyl-L-tyrosine phosphorylase/[glutamate--ammonia-ligase] adenylyltransferase, partial [Verrucomicrobiae bacterium]|nr:bifunctional [glutamate--ammonia ligase]-adenylyl-L-tyrosine phosphorylase/[glutamate--ammonia-ligase] adenylyltransferase [Verrucomicrobiae bacterium]